MRVLDKGWDVLWKEREYLNSCGVGGLLELFDIWEMVGTCDSITGGFRARDTVWSVGVVELVEDVFFSTQGPDASHILQGD